MSIRVLDEHDVRRLLPMDECIEVMAEALASLMNAVAISESLVLIMRTFLIWSGTVAGSAVLPG